MLRKNRDNLVFFLITFAYWASNSVYYLFLVLYLSSHGYSKFMCGVASTALAVTSMLVQPVIGYLADHILSAKKLLIISFSLAVPLTFLLPFTLTIIPLAILSIIILAAFDYSAFSTIDSWVMQLQRSKPDINYGMIRPGGSLGYAFTSLIFGSVIARFGFPSMFYVHAALMLLLVLLCLLGKEPEKLEKNSDCQGKSKINFTRGITQLIRFPAYVILLLCILLFQLAQRGHATFLAIILGGIGGGSVHLGTALFISSCVEALTTFLVTIVIRRQILPLEVLYAIGFAAGILRTVTFGLSIPLPAMVGLEAFAGMANGFNLSVSYECIRKTAPKELLATAITLSNAAAGGFGSGIGNLIGGAIIERRGIPAFAAFSTMALICALMLLGINYLILHHKVNA